MRARIPKSMESNDMSSPRDIRNIPWAVSAKAFPVRQSRTSPIAMSMSIILLCWCICYTLSLIIARIGALRYLRSASVVLCFFTVTQETIFRPVGLAERPIRVPQSVGDPQTHGSPPRKHRLHDGQKNDLKTRTISLLNPPGSYTITLLPKMTC